MFGIGYQELLIFGAIAMFLFGADKLPKLARGLGTSLTEFKKGIKGIEEELK